MPWKFLRYSILVVCNLVVWAMMATTAATVARSVTVPVFVRHWATLRMRLLRASLARAAHWWWLSCSPVELFPPTCWHYLQHLVRMDAMKCALTSSTWNSTFSLRALLRVYTGAAAATASRSGLAMPLSKSEAAELDLAFFASRALFKMSSQATITPISITSKLLESSIIGFE